MRLLKFGRFSEIDLTIFGTQKTSQRKKHENNLHTYTTRLTILILCKIHDVGCLHKIEATYIKQGFFAHKTHQENINLLIDCKICLTYRMRNFLFRWGNKMFQRGNNTF